VCLNLIINAAHAIPPGNYESNQVRVATSVDEQGRVVIAVTDTGSGMPPEVTAQLFTPFFTTKPAGVGTGLGLAITQKIVSQFGGTIAFETAVGRGTTFTVAFPVASGRAARRTAPPPLRAPAARQGTVLVVDDDEAVGLAIRRCLASDHDVVALRSAREALALLGSGRRFDLILCDVMMPQVTGMDLHAAVIAIDATQAGRIVFLTGGAFTASAREFLERIPNRRIDKPFEPKELQRLVNELIR
jgi:CheY-like chemotaxis protein